MLPDSIDPGDLRTAALVAMAVVAVGIVVTLRFVTRMAVRVAIVGALIGVGLGLWAQRDDLENCAATCSCQFIGQQVETPGCP